MERNLLNVLLSEKKNKVKGGIYNKLQVDFAYNSNHMEGSKLSHDQTRYIYETKTIGGEPARVNDILETVNHFRCVDFALETISEPLSEEYLKTLHRILKTGTLGEESFEAVVGDYKKYPNYAGDMKTASPEEIPLLIQRLLSEYEPMKKTLYAIIDFHARFEKIHPFYDGNGRVGRLIMFKECLKNSIVPFLVEDVEKSFYYRGLKEWQSGGEKGYLVDTCLMMQDTMKATLDYFRIDYDKSEVLCRDVPAEGDSESTGIKFSM